MSHCPNCGSEKFKPVAAILEISATRKILGHLGIPDKPPVRRLHHFSNRKIGSSAGLSGYLAWYIR
jgi:hypothetical protein